mmetsp:Transcript_551/g.1849  ORF Transcript_551/g.1849 Transcript_551/m.1849 type:complete len:168 (-) Transcript_551:241-744(-)
MPIDGSSHAALYRLKIDDAIISSIKPTRVGGYDVARVGGILRTTGQLRRGIAAVLEPPPPLARGTTVLGGATASRVGATGTGAGAAAGADGKRRVALLSVGPVKLAELRAGLGQDGKPATLSGGALLVDGGTVRLSKPEPRRLIIDGNFGPAFLRARKRAFSQLTAI